VLKPSIYVREAALHYGGSALHGTKGENKHTFEAKETKRGLRGVTQLKQAFSPLLLIPVQTCVISTLSLVDYGVLCASAICSMV
jgi:hypothetical protein